MRFKTSIACFVLACAMSGCIQDEALNSEAAIDACTGSDIQQSIIDPDNYKIQLYVSRAADLTHVNINFQLPNGATIAPATPQEGDDTSASFFNFETENPRKFKVTSEDQEFSATYTVTSWQTEMPTSYHFEALSSENPYHIFYEQDNSEGTDGKFFIRRLEWASGNPGYQLTAQAKTAADYPTVQIANGGIGGGKYVKLETKSTGSFGTMVGMPLAAGNLFIGSFDRTNAVNNPMAATHFGFPFFYEPDELSGYYTFKRGSQFTSDGKPVEGKQDECDIYGVLYETNENLQFLDGSNSLDSDQIIALARKSDGYWPETDLWKPFKCKFTLKPGKTIDPEKLKKGIYKLAIVFSSSVEGAKFNGAIGSTLCIDEVTLTVKE